MHSIYASQSPILSNIGKNLSAICSYFPQKSGYHISITIYTASTDHLPLYSLPISNRLVSQTLYSFPKLPERLMGIDAVSHIASCMA